MLFSAIFFFLFFFFFPPPLFICQASFLPILVSPPQSKPPLSFPSCLTLSACLFCHTHAHTRPAPPHTHCPVSHFANSQHIQVPGCPALAPPSAPPAPAHTPAAPHHNHTHTALSHTHSFLPSLLHSPPTTNQHSLPPPPINHVWQRKGRKGIGQGRR